ncbi:uncharacterized protein LOC123501025 [Portunus trituberculatus]|uniref:uncharacterized protein LOC123501025 n=1 Tax=Portunus trituberculatus TaxID=210409 RepID=UPI001E1D101E|nr:uncharacterized protein LOC123501025 [Portunus trituberculatus]
MEPGRQEAMEAERRFISKMDAIKKKREQLETTRREMASQHEGYIMTRSQAIQRNSRLVQEVQREVAQMRTVLSSPLLPHLLRLKEAYLSPSSSSSRAKHTSATVVS